MWRLLCLVSAVCAAVSWQAELVQAGGTQVAVVAVAGRLWVTTGADVVKLDATTARIIGRRKTRYPFPIDIGLSDGNVWVSSVENGFVSGALTRIPFDAGPAAQPLVFPSRPLLGLAVGSGTTWALVGPWASLKLAAVDQATDKPTIVPLHTRIGWIAADDVGDTPGLFGTTSAGRAVRLGPDGRVVWRASTDPIESPPAVGLGSVWAASRSGLYRITPATGHVEAKLPLNGSAAQLTTGGGYVWMINLRETTSGERYTLFKIDPRSTRVVRQAGLAGPLGPIAFGSGALWTGRATPTVSVIRIDPKTLAERVFAKNLG